MGQQSVRQAARKAALDVRVARRARVQRECQYQRPVNQLIVIFFMIGHMTEGAYQLPCIAQ